MNPRSVQAPEETPRPRWRRLIVPAIVGLLFGLLAIGFVTRVYDPFAQALSDPLVLMPEDLDLVIDCSEVPRFIRELPTASFVEGLKAHPGFARFLQSSYMRGTGIEDALQSVYDQIAQLDKSLPLGLQVLGDLTGERITLGIFEEGKTPGEPDLFLVFQPESWLAIAGANVLLDGTLGPNFVDEALEKSGFKVQRERDLVTLSPRVGRSFSVTRVADAILVATDKDHLARVYGRLATLGLPKTPHPRFSVLRKPGPEASRLKLFGRVPLLDEKLRLKQTLQELWGAEQLALARRLLWPIAETDLLLEVDVGRGFLLKATFEIDGDGADSFASLSSTFTDKDLKREVQDFSALWSEDAFGFMRLDTRLGPLLTRFLKSPGAMATEDQRLLDEALSRVPSAKSLDHLLRTVDRATNAKTYAWFFKQPREALEDEAEAGLALFASLAREEEMRRLLNDLAREIESLQGRGDQTAIKRIRFDDRDRISSWTFDLAAGVVDDDRVTQPAVGIVGDWLVITNTKDLFDRLRAVRRREVKSLEEFDGLARALTSQPRMAHATAGLDMTRLFAYVDQSIDGWVHKRVTPTAAEQIRWAQAGVREAVAQGLTPSSPEYDAVIDRSIRREEQLREGQRAKIEGDFRTRVEELRGLFAGLGLSLERQGDRMTLSLRLELSLPNPSR